MASQCIACGVAVSGHLKTRKRQQSSIPSSAVTERLPCHAAPTLAYVWHRRCKRKAVLQAKKHGDAESAEVSLALTRAEITVESV